MSKGIIVVDVPENCGYCDFNALCGDGKHRCGVGSIEDIIDGYEDSIPDWCPIKPYDLDKTVKQLEDIKMRHFLTMANTGDNKLDLAYEYVGNALDTAIEIVKGGTV